MTLKSFFARLAASTLLLVPVAAGAETIQYGDLIKASGPSVYYYGQNGKRYVFPNEKTFTTWYGGFSSVKTITDGELAAIPIGGNVTYRPGVKLVKVTTDPRTYAVGAGGTLRWIQTESVARELYGTDWNTKVDDVPDPFFVNYKIGSPIPTSGEFSTANELALATSIGRDKNLDQATPAPTPAPTPTSTTPTSTPPTPTPAPSRSGTLTATPEEATVNQLVTLIATAQPSTGIWYINVSFDGFLARRCEFSPCGADVRTGTEKTSYVATAEYVWGDMSRAYATTTVYATAGSPGITLTITRPEIQPNAQREIIVDVDSSFVAKTIDLFLDGVNVRGCNDVQQCRYTATETGAVGTTHQAYAVIRDANGFARQSAVKTFSVVTNPRPLVTVSPGKTSLFRGETVDVNVSASDDDGVTYTEIRTSDDTFTKRCESSFCTAQVMRSTAGNFRFIGVAGDAAGMIGSATSSEIVVQ